MRTRIITILGTALLLLAVGCEKQGPTGIEPMEPSDATANPVSSTSFIGITMSTSATVTVYDQDRPGWENAICAYEEEFFEDATFNTGVSVVTDYPGYVDVTKGVWWDRLTCPGSGSSTTTWQFATPLAGFGGNWDPGVPGGPGAAIAVAINGSWVSVGEIPQTYEGQFWGFVSTEPFSAVRLMHGSNCDAAWCETYELDNMVYGEPLEVPLDIKPGSDPNSINPKSKGKIPVAILGSASFAVADVDVTTLEFDPNGAASAHDLTDPIVYAEHLQDVNGDGLTDLVSHYNTQDTGIAEGNTEACISGVTTGGVPLSGCDAIRIVGKN